MGVEGAADLLKAIAADPILTPYAGQLRAYARPSIRLRVDNDARRHVGESRVGGRPAAPDDFTWPTRTVEMPRPSDDWIRSHSFPPRLLPSDGVSAFEFIAQIDLAEVAPYDSEGRLPDQGTLLFFYDEFYQSDITPGPDLTPTSWTLEGGQPQFYQREFGYDQYDQVRVIHIPGGHPLRRHDSGPHQAAAQRLVPSADWTIPSVDSYLVAPESTPESERDGRVVLPPEAWSRLAELDYEWRANANIDQLLGWADNFAHGPSLAPEIRALADLPHEDRLREAQDPRLLLQLSPATYEPTGIRFGRTLYFYARESDLRRGDFSRAWYDSD
jgi:hypothetical protein